MKANLNLFFIKGCDTINIYQVYEKYNKDFIAFARSVTQAHDRALDLVQDTYVAAMEREEIFEVMNEYQIKGWFFTTIKNKNIDFIRKQKRLTSMEEADFPEETAEFEQEIELDDLLACLPESNRRVVALRYKLNLNSKEIGKILNLSPSTVRSRLSRAMMVLKENLSKED